MRQQILNRLSRYAIAALASSIILWPSLAFSQQLTTGVMRTCTLDITSAPHDVTIEKARRTLSLEQLNDAAGTILSDLRTKLANARAEAEKVAPSKGTLPQPPCVLPPDAGHQFRLIWIGANQKGEEQLFHSIVRSSSDVFLTQRVSGAWTKGLKLIDVFITSQPRTRLDEEIGATAAPDPDVTKLSELIERSKLVDAIAFGLGNLGSAPARLLSSEPTEGFLHVQVLEPNVPVKRGALEMRQTVSIGFPSATTVTDFNERVQSFLDAIPATPNADQVCANAVNKRLGVDLTRLVDTPAPQCAAGSRDDDCDTFVRLAAERLLVEVRDISCKTPANLTFGASAAVLALYRSAILPRSVTTIAKLNNVPVSRVSFSGLTAVIGSPTFPQGSIRVKESNGLIAADSLPRLLTAVVINYHPFGYEPSDRTRPTWRESFRFFAGPTINPEPGIAVGIAFGITRNLALAVGGSLLAFDALRADSQLGAKPVNTRDPFQTEWLRAGLVGFQLKF